MRTICIEKLTLRMTILFKAGLHPLEYINYIIERLGRNQGK
jgi:hypothetical protein